ncbi:type IV secretory system conjugative DNA transfer family protein [Luteibacter aegosomatissinici]|uniref:type IV secretory system conjugative DNA transfer family protein n=1 Tax=Luteibacter aegosomatissinici TaxID=2911539 RepID=UPI001FF885B1|nr:type IV secretory system conjugative DNA transfer family protein [Luteibacter aegosomatissinici]UPG93610.1 type IV secretory system conjugative DNA transfer family protein [Luteibacter aegosomatissinici]
MRTGKVVAAVATVVGALAWAPWITAHLLARLLGVDVSERWWLAWWAYYQHVHEPAYQPYAWRIWLAGGVGAGIPLLIATATLILLFRSPGQALHGKARFASRRDLARKGMFKHTPTALVVGRRGRRFVYMSGQQFAILAAPTRTGKGVGIVIPNLLSYQGSVVVLDIKQENFDLTSGWRKAQGQEVYLFNPFAEDLRTARWNPLHYVSDGLFRISDIMALAETLYPDSGGADGFWVSQARNAFVAFTMYLFERRDAQSGGSRLQPSHEPTLGEVFRISTGEGDDFKAYLQGLATQPYLSDATRNAFNNLLSQAEDTFASILGSFREPLNMFLNPVLDAATSGNDFLLTDVRKKKMTIYIGIQPNKLAESRVLINMFFSQLVKLNTSELPAQNKELQHQCLLLMDEFTAIGRVDILASAVSFIAGYNLRVLPIIQSLSQLDAVYGPDVARSFVTNHALQIVYTPREQRDANDYSEMLGYTTVRQKSISRGQGISVTHNDERRALMLPQELKAMSQDKEVFFYEGIPHPVMADKIRYYQEKYFTRRLMPKVDVETLKVKGVKPSKGV